MLFMKTNRDMAISHIEIKPHSLLTRGNAFFDKYHTTGGKMNSNIIEAL